MPPPIVFLNGEYLPKEAVRISPDDRGFLFADGIYDVIRVVDGRLYRRDAHVSRLRSNAADTGLALDDAEALVGCAERLLAANGLERGQATLYIQVTRGVAVRTHAFPDPAVPPTVYAAAAAFTPRPERHERGIAAITVPDIRWARCDIKSVSLLPNVLAAERARRAGAVEALFVRDGVLLEGAHSSCVAVIDGALLTAPLSNYILPGITRHAVLGFAHRLGLPVREAPVFVERRAAIDELFICGTTTDVTPVVTLDGRPIGRGEPGPVTRKLQEALEADLEGGEVEASTF